MSKWIDTDKLIDDLDRYCKPKLSDYDMTNPEHLTIQEIKYYSESRMYDEILEEIQGSDSVDVAPIVHGYWKANRKLRMPECSVCEARPFRGYIPSMYEVEKTYKYCPNCGAKIDESEDNE